MVDTYFREKPNFCPHEYIMLCVRFMQSYALQSCSSGLISKLCDCLVHKEGLDQLICSWCDINRIECDSITMKHIIAFIARDHLYQVCTLKVYFTCTACIHASYSMGITRIYTQKINFDVSNSTMVELALSASPHSSSSCSTSISSAIMTR